MTVRSVHIGALIGPGLPPEGAPARMWVEVAPAYKFVDGTAINWPIPVEFDITSGDVTIEGMQDTYLGEDLVWAFHVYRTDVRGNKTVVERVTKTFPEGSGAVEYTDMVDVDLVVPPEYGPSWATQAAASETAAATSAATALTAKNDTEAIAGNYVILDTAPGSGDLDEGQIGFLISPAWTPLNLTSLQIWGDETVSPPADGADYGSLVDISGHARNLTPGSAAQATDVAQYDADGINGHGCAYFPLVSVLNAGTVTLGTGPIMVAAIVKMGAVTALAQTVWNGQDSGSTQTMLLDRTSAGTAWRIRRSGTTVTFTHASASDGLVHVIIVVYNGASSQMYVDGTLIGSGDPGSGSVTLFKLGMAGTASGSANGATNMRVMQPIVATQVPTATEITRLTTYLTAKAA